MNELPRHWMKNFFYASFSLEKFKNTVCVDVLNSLLYFFVNSNFVLNQIANAFYNNQEFDSA
jgi:anaphase-promoting complex subunit 8